MHSTAWTYSVLTLFFIHCSIGLRMRHFSVVFSTITGLEAWIHQGIVDILLVAHLSKITSRITQAGISLVLNVCVAELTVSWRKIYMRRMNEIQRSIELFWWMLAEASCFETQSLH
ncbi:hypothetical protein PDJAM_G00122790 [Pangasius djambal]|uniref:Uncharacterized protein n=1 Tax=Pangasius djambal TaxID=1691987 RepID=A0ACC5ZB43_9TELE|nr:hypothetical protein [Pangasius djambal]